MITLIAMVAIAVRVKIRTVARQRYVVAHLLLVIGKGLLFWRRQSIADIFQHLINFPVGLQPNRPAALLDRLHAVAPVIVAHSLTALRTRITITAVVMILRLTRAAIGVIGFTVTGILAALLATVAFVAVITPVALTAFVARIALLLLYGLIGLAKRH